MTELKKQPSPKFPCGMVISFSSDGDVFMKHGKSGSCEHCSAEAMARLINIAPKDKIVKALRRLSCEHGVLGASSCYDFIAKHKEGK